MYLEKEIEDKSLRALVLKWNRDNSDNYELFFEDVKKEVGQDDEEKHSDKFDSRPSGKTNIILPVDADLWGDFVKFGGREVYLAEHVNEFLTNYVIEQRSYRIDN